MLIATISSEWIESAIHLSLSHTGATVIKGAMRIDARICMHLVAAIDRRILSVLSEWSRAFKLHADVLLLVFLHRVKTYCCVSPQAVSLSTSLLLFLLLLSSHVVSSPEQRRRVSEVTCTALSRTTPVRYLR